MKKVVVIGAGIVGVSCAVQLMRQGCQVTLVDRDLPGQQCSFGNAGTLMGNAHFPSAGMLPKIPGMLLNPNEPLSILWRDFPAMLPWFLSYVRQSRPSRTAEIADAAAALNSMVHPSMAGLLHATGASEFLRWGGRLFAYRSEAALRDESALMKLKNQAGIEMREISGEEARDMEPALGPLVARAVFTPDAGHVVNPFRLVQHLAQHFIQAGGTLVRDDVKGFRFDGARVTGVLTGAGDLQADEFVVAAGAWSSTLARHLGVKLRLIAERGYHAMITRPAVAMKIPTMWSDRKILLVPMEHGIRIAGLSEFGSADAPPNFGKVQRMLLAAREVLPGLDISSHQPWMGARPATPDYLPIIGRPRAHGNVVFACGHGHSGLMFGPVTADLVAQVVAGQRTAIELSPFSPNRFL